MVVVGIVMEEEGCSGEILGEEVKDGGYRGEKGMGKERKKGKVLGCVCGRGYWGGVEG